MNTPTREIASPYASRTTPAAPQCGRSARTAFGPASLHRVHDLNVVRLKGSFYEMGHQHGTLLRDQIPHGPIPYYRRYVEKLIGPALGSLSPVVWPLLQHLVGRRVGRKMPGFALDTIRGLADGAGIPLADMMDGCTMPDSLLWVAAQLMRLKRPGRAIGHRLALGLGCTSAIAWGDATRDGKLLHARNLDYHGVGSWPRTAAVLFHEPTDGQRFVSVAAAGVGLGGVTAMNEAGLTLTVHQHMFTDTTTLGGTPIGVVGDIVMREATTLDEAEAILARHTPIGCWTYLVADGRRREVLCWEESPQRQAARRIREPETHFGYANVYLDEELGATEVNLYGSYWRHNEGRHRRARQLLGELAGTLDPRGMASIIADVGDPQCRIRNAVGMVLTVGSVVLSPEDGIVWVGTGEAPTSHGEFVPFSLATMDHAPEAGSFRVGPDPSSPEHQGFELYRRAYIAYLDDGDIPAARGLMNEARERCPDQPLYHFLSGMMSIHEGDGASADRAISRAIEIGHPDAERVAASHLWRTRALDLSGRREEAIAGYRAALERRADPPVREAARRGIQRAYRRRDAERLHVDFALADVVTP
jgi:hypothetical protein